MSIFWRLALGLALVALALWIIIGEQITGASADATINARVVTVRSPIAGDLDLPARGFGASVRAGEVIGSVDNRLVDGVRVDDLVLEVDLADAAIARHTALRDETAALIEDLTERADTFRTRRIAEIDLRLDFARERLALLQEGVFPPAFDIAPPDDAGVERGTEPDIDGLQELWINAVEERIAVLENERAAAEAGVFLGDGYNDAPNSEQRITELRSDLATQTVLLAEAEARRAAYADRLDSERLRTNRSGRTEIVTPVTGRLWEVLEADGVNLQRGDPVASILDCRSVMVTASVTEQVYNSLSVGDAATFRPNGDGRTFEGTIIRLAGAGAETIYRDLAVAPSERHLQRYDVALSVPGLAGEPELSCAVGRTGRVFFDRRPLDLLRGGNG
ncbi:HlyD family efflux transporter periplasmic adaptor subunit [Rhodobacterales bacterium HKCCE3408]|nr:HlyD family efflux transporter periplasmic adaptor subunit [Rhodobacterales bacterium HKCCE3408]